MTLSTTTNSKLSTSRPMRWAKRLGVSILVLMGTSALGIVIFQNVSDGPYDMLQGGAFRSGELVDARAANFEAMEGEPSELLLVGPGTSRTLGYFMRDGQVYISCDLGFIWNRLEGTEKHIMNLIYVFKRWHLNAIEDGRAELRIAGNRYPGFLHLVEEEALNSALKMQLEDLARAWFAPEVLCPRSEAPNDILFFRFEPGGSR